MGRIETFTVSPAEASSRESQELCLWVGCYVDQALCENRGGYKGSELPPLAEHFYDLWTYYGEWRNGGHAYYYGNIPDPESWARASELLGGMGLVPYQQLLDDFIAFSVVNEDRITELFRSGQEPEAIRSFDPFDDRFRNLEKESGPLHLHLHDWLLRQSWLTIDPTLSLFHSGLLDHYVPPHPRQAARRAANIRRRKAEIRGGAMAFVYRLRDRLSGGGGNR